MTMRKQHIFRSHNLYHVAIFISTIGCLSFSNLMIQTCRNQYVVVDPNTDIGRILAMNSGDKEIGSQIVSTQSTIPMNKATASNYLAVDTSIVSTDSKKNETYENHTEWPPTDVLISLLEHNGNKNWPSDYYTESGVPRFIVAASNSDFVDFADNFASSLLRLNITNFVFVPLDTNAYDKLHRVYPKHTLPILPGLQSHPEGRASYGSKAFELLTASRPIFLQPFIRKGYAVFYNDIDTVWQHNAWNEIDAQNIDDDNIENGNDTKIEIHSKINDTSSASSNYETILWQDGLTQICTCMMYFLPTPNSLSLLQNWENEIKSKKHKEDQLAFNVVAQRHHIPIHGGIYNKTKVLMNDLRFPTGKMYNWERSWKFRHENSQAIIIHNNWILGKEAKLRRFNKTGLWKPSGRLSGRNKNNASFFVILRRLYIYFQQKLK